jgi:hypothetical protein
MPFKQWEAPWGQAQVPPYDAFLSATTRVVRCEVVDTTKIARSKPRRRENAAKLSI